MNSTGAPAEKPVATWNVWVLGVYPDEGNQVAKLAFKGIEAETGPDAVTKVSKIVSRMLADGVRIDAHSFVIRPGGYGLFGTTETEGPPGGTQG